MTPEVFVLKKNACGLHLKQLVSLAPLGPAHLNMHENKNYDHWHPALSPSPSLYQ